MREAVSTKGLSCGYGTCLLISLEPLGVFPVPCMGHQNFDLKQTGCQILLQQRRVYLGSANNYSLESAPMVSHVQVLAGQGQENSFIEGRRKLGGL